MYHLIEFKGIKKKNWHCLTLYFYHSPERQTYRNIGVIAVSWGIDFNIKLISFGNSSCQNEVSFMQNCKFYAASNLADWQLIDSPQQDVFLWTVGKTEPSSGTVSQNNERWNASQTKLAALFTSPRPPCLFLSYTFLLNTPLTLKAFPVVSVEELMQVERLFFSFHLSEK